MGDRCPAGAYDGPNWRAQWWARVPVSERRAALRRTGDGERFDDFDICQEWWTGDALTVRTLADIEHGVRKASPGTYAMLENKLAWAPGSIDTIVAGGEPRETVVELHRSNPNTSPQGYALRPTPNALSQASTEDLLLELRRRIVAPRDRRPESWDDWDGGLDPDGHWPAHG
jgi:hypothetical protein